MDSTKGLNSAHDSDLAPFFQSCDKLALFFCMCINVSYLGHGVSNFMSPKKQGFWSKINCSQVKLM